MTENLKDNGREIVHELRHGNVVIEVYEKINPKTGNVYYDYKNYREFFTGDDQVGRGPYLQQRDIRDHVTVLMELMRYISDCHRERKSRDDY